MIELELPWPPSVNNYWTVSVYKGKPNWRVSKAGTDYRKSVIRRCKFITSKIRQSVSVDIQAFPPDRRKRDLDNLQKALFDSLTHANVWQDDSLVDDFRVRRREVSKPGKVIVKVSIIGKQAA